MSPTTVTVILTYILYSLH